jgi:LPS export ABC transporter protein LptC
MLKWDAGLKKVRRFALTKRSLHQNVFLGSMVISAMVMLLSCTPTTHKPGDFEIDRSIPTEEAFDIRVNYSDSGNKQIEMEAPHIIRFGNAEEPYTEYPKGMHVLFYDRYGEVNSSITANYAVQYDQQRVTEARNDVVVVNRKGETLHTEHLIWDEQEEKIYTEEFVRITTENESITGYGFEADQEFDSYTIKKIRGTINFEENEDSIPAG